MPTSPQPGKPAVIKRWPIHRNPSLGDDQFVRDEFAIDYTVLIVTCPNGVTVTISANGSAMLGPRCKGCPIRSRCTTNRTGRVVDVTEHDQLLADARARWRAGTDLYDYRHRRPVVEHSIAWIVTNDHRRVRYRGVDRNRIALSIRAAVINLRRLLNLGLAHEADAWTLNT